jgi:hypothetical protein
MSTSPGTDRATRHRDTEAIPPVRKSIHVPWSVERAFRRFTREIADWWPLSTYSVGEGKSDTVTFESRVGGRLFETLQDGTEAEWGRVTTWEPPPGSPSPGIPAGPRRRGRRSRSRSAPTATVLTSS